MIQCIVPFLKGSCCIFLRLRCICLISSPWYEEDEPTPWLSQGLVMLPWPWSCPKVSSSRLCGEIIHLITTITWDNSAVTSVTLPITLTYVCFLLCPSGTMRGKQESTTPVLPVWKVRFIKSKTEYYNKLQKRNILNMNRSQEWMTYWYQVESWGNDTYKVPKTHCN